MIWVRKDAVMFEEAEGDLDDQCKRFGNFRRFKIKEGVFGYGSKVTLVR